MRYGLAVLACIGIFFVYMLIAMSMDWRGTQPFIPMLILCSVLIATWSGITQSG